MIGSYLTRGLVMVFGYAYPAYACYKAVEKNKPEIQQLRFWCQYWILVAAFTVFERVGDTFASWVPLYSEAKLAFFIYLWFPKTSGTTYVYDSFFRPYVSKHENEIDRNLIELRTKAGDMAVIYCRKAVCYGQTRFTEFLQFIALQSTPKPKPKEKKEAAPEKEEQKKQPDLNIKESQAAATIPQGRLQSKKPQVITKEPITLKPSSSPRKQQQQQTESKEAKLSVSQITKLAALPPQTSPSSTTKPDSDSAQAPSTTEAEKASQRIAGVPASTIQRASSSKETIMEETLRVTRGSLRKARSTGTR